MVINASRKMWELACGDMYRNGESLKSVVEGSDFEHLGKLLASFVNVGKFKPQMEQPLSRRNQ